MSDESPSRAAPTQFRPGRLEPDLRARGDSDGVTAKRDLERLYTLIPRTLERLSFTLAEAQLLADCADGTLWNPASIPLLWAEVEDVIRLDGLHTTRGVDGGALVGKLTLLSPLDALAVVDALERAWRQPEPASPAVLKAVGLVHRK